MDGREVANTLLNVHLWKEEYKEHLKNKRKILKKSCLKTESFSTEFFKFSIGNRKRMKRIRFWEKNSFKTWNVDDYKILNNQTEEMMQYQSVAGNEYFYTLLLDVERVWTVIISMVVCWKTAVVFLSSRMEQDEGTQQLFLVGMKIKHIMINMRGITLHFFNMFYGEGEGLLKGQRQLMELSRQSTLKLVIL